MRAALRYAYSSDINIETYVPERPECDGIWLRLVVGPADEPGEESFDVLVCTPLWLQQVVREHGPQVGQHHLIVEPLDLAVAIEFLRKQVENTQGSNWNEVGEKLARLGHWEFDDYQA